MSRRGLEPFLTPKRSCFRLVLVVRRCTSVSLHFQPRCCLYTFSIPQSLSVSIFVSVCLTSLSTKSQPIIFFFYSSFWPHRGGAQRESINHSVQIKSQIIIIENNGFHVSFSTALNCSCPYLETCRLEAQKSKGDYVLVGWDSSNPWTLTELISKAIKLLSEFEHLSCKNLTMSIVSDNRLYLLKSNRSSQETQTQLSNVGPCTAIQAWQDSF